MGPPFGWEGFQPFEGWSNAPPILSFAKRENAPCAVEERKREGARQGADGLLRKSSARGVVQAGGGSCRDCSSLSFAVCPALVGADLCVRPSLRASDREEVPHMNKNSGSVLFLLQDIKELAFGIALSLLGGILLCASPLDWDADELFLILSFPVLVYGAFRIRNGGGSHVLIITNDFPKEGDIHVL